MSVIGNLPAQSFNTIRKQTITGDGDSSYSLDYSVSGPNDLEVFVNNVRQEPTIAYNASSQTLTMSEGIDSTDDFYVIYKAQALGTTSLPHDQPITITGLTLNGTMNAGTIGTAVSFPSGSVIQTVNKTWDASFQTSSTSYVDITNASATITPRFNNSKILFMLSTMWGMESWNLGHFRLLRGTTNIGAAGSENAIRTLQNQVESGATGNSGGFGIPFNLNYIDSPATTSSTTYKLQVRCDSGGPLHVGNRPQSTAQTVLSSIILQEIAG